MADAPKGERLRMGFPLDHDAVCKPNHDRHSRADST